MRNPSRGKKLRPEGSSLSLTTSLTTGPFLIHASAAPFNCTNMTNALLPSRQNQKIYHANKDILSMMEKRKPKGE